MAARLDGGLRRGFDMLLKIMHFVFDSALEEARPFPAHGPRRLPDQGSQLIAQNRETFGEVGIEGSVPRGLELRKRTVS